MCGNRQVSRLRQTLKRKNAAHLKDQQVLMRLMESQKVTPFLLPPSLLEGTPAQAFKARGEAYEQQLQALQSAQQSDGTSSESIGGVALQEKHQELYRLQQQLLRSPKGAKKSLRQQAELLDNSIHQHYYREKLNEASSGAVEQAAAVLKTGSLGADHGEARRTVEELKEQLGNAREQLAAASAAKLKAQQERDVAVIELHGKLTEATTQLAFLQQSHEETLEQAKQQAEQTKALVEALEESEAAHEKALEEAVAMSAAHEQANAAHEVMVADLKAKLERVEQQLAAASGAQVKANGRSDRTVDELQDSKGHRIIAARQPVAQKLLCTPSEADIVAKTLVQLESEVNNAQRRLSLLVRW